MSDVVLSAAEVDGQIEALRERAEVTIGSVVLDSSIGDEVNEREPCSGRPQLRSGS